MQRITLKRGGKIYRIKTRKQFSDSEEMNLYLLKFKQKFEIGAVLYVSKE